MGWLWAVGIILALLIILCLTRTGVLGVFADGALTLDIRFGLFRFRILPGKKRRKKQEKNKAEEPAEKPKEQTKRPRAKLSKVKDAAQTLWPPLKKALTRTRKGVRIHPLTLSLLLGGKEAPADTAILYGRLHAGMWTVMPWLESVLVIPDPHLHIGMDFDTAETRIYGTFGLTARLGTLLHIGLGVAGPALRWFLKNRKKEQAEPVKSAAA